MDQFLGPQSHHPSVARDRTEERSHYAYVFKLAWFLHPNRSIASKIAHESIVGLPDTYSAQARRTEYTPKGQFRTRVSMERDHLVQRRVFAASEPYEKECEESGSITTEDLTVYFVKEVLRESMKHASFQVTVSMGRVLHSYRTREVMNMYGTIAPNRSAKKNDDQSREWKKEVTDYLLKRFGRYLSITIGPRGEKRFTPATDCRFLALGKECFRRFVPRHTDHVIPRLCGRIAPEALNYVGCPDGEHATEIQRFHACICPDCLLNLACGWNLDPPDRRLSIPAFNLLPGSGDSGYSDRGAPPELSDSVIDSALDDIAAEKERRRKVSPSKLRVLVDGDLRSVLDLCEPKPLSVKVLRGEEVVEIISEGGEILITHLLTYGDENDDRVLTTEYTVCGVTLAFLEQQGGRSTERVFNIQSRPLASNSAVLLSSSAETTCPAFPSGSQNSLTDFQRLRGLLREVLSSCERARPLMLMGSPGCGKTYLAKHLVETLRECVHHRYEATAFTGSLEAGPIRAISDVRAKLEVMEHLALTQGDLYRRYCELAEKRRVGLQIVPHVDDEEEKLSRWSLWGGVSLSTLAAIILRLHDPLGVLATATPLVFGVLCWRYFRWSSRLTSRYLFVKDLLESMQLDLWGTHQDDPVSRWHKIFTRTRKAAFLCGADQEREILGLVLQARGYDIEVCEQDISAAYAALLDENFSSTPDGSTFMFYFSGHGCSFEDCWALPSETVHQPRLFEAESLQAAFTQILSNKPQEKLLVLLGAGCSIRSSWSTLSVTARHCHSTPWRTIGYEHALRACNEAFIEAFAGGAAGPDGLVTFSDVVRYIGRKLRDPNVVEQAGNVVLDVRYSDRRSKDILLSTVPARSPPGQKRKT